MGGRGGGGEGEGGGRKDHTKVGARRPPNLFHPPGGFPPPGGCSQNAGDWMMSLHCPYRRPRHNGPSLSLFCHNPLIALWLLRRSDLTYSKNMRRSPRSGACQRVPERSARARDTCRRARHAFRSTRLPLRDHRSRQGFDSVHHGRPAVVSGFPGFPLRSQGHQVNRLLPAMDKQ